MKKRKATIFLALLLAMAMLCAACSPSGPSGNSQEPGTTTQEPGASENVPAENQSDTLRVVIGAEPSNIMPLSAEAGDGQWIAWCMYDRLVGYDAATGELVPALATSWKLS